VVQILSLVLCNHSFCAHIVNIWNSLPNSGCWCRYCMPVQSTSR